MPITNLSMSDLVLQLQQNIIRLENEVRSLKAQKDVLQAQLDRIATLRVSRRFGDPFDHGRPLV